MVSIKDISERCGVSVATVSKALNGKKDISNDTREMVLKTAEEMNYYPNPNAKTLRTKHSNMIGIILTGEDFCGLCDEFFSHMFLSIKNSCEELGYELQFINKKVGSQSMTYLQRCKFKNIDGVILAYVQYQEPQIQELLNSDIPVITVDNRMDKRSTVCFDYTEGIQSLVHYIYQLGHRRIAYIHGEDKEHSNTQDRLRSFYCTTDKLGIKVPDVYVREGRYIDARLCRKLTEELLNLPEPPTCIMYPNDYSAIAGIGEINRLGMSVPEDVSVVGYDGITIANVVWPELTTYAQNVEMMGRRIVEQLVKLIEEQKKETVVRLNVTGTLVNGASVKDLNRSINHSGG